MIPTILISAAASDIHPSSTAAAAMKPSPPSPPLQPWRLQELLSKHSFSRLRNLTRPSRPFLHLWLIRFSTAILLWTCFIQLISIVQLWHPRLHATNLVISSPRNCLIDSIHPITAERPATPVYQIEDRNSVHNVVPVDPDLFNSTIISIDNLHSPSRDLYRSNGILLISCNGGLNQMRAAICDMVAIASHLNLTLFIPELDKSSFWADQSDFGDIFDVDHFIESLKDEVRIIKELPAEIQQKHVAREIMSMPPISWSNESYYMDRILPLVKKEKAIRFNKTDTRLANNGLPLKMQKLRCRANYESLKFTPRIEELGQKVVRLLKEKGGFLVLHLRYEMDMLAFSGCSHGCTDAETDELTKMRYDYPWWKEKVINSTQKRIDGLCPLTPEETALVLSALGFGRETQIYIAAGDIYGSERRMAPLRAAFPNIVKKEMLLSPEELKHFQNHSSQMAALDYLVAVESDVFIPTYDGNMAKVVEGHRRYLGYRKTLLLDRRKLVELIDLYQSNQLTWDGFSLAVKEHHDKYTGSPTRRNVVPDRPKEEDYFYANPEECLK